MPMTKCGKFYYYGRKSRVKMMDELNQRYDVDVDHVRLNLKQYWRKSNDRRAIYKTTSRVIAPISVANQCR
jgi:hypothetical protein